MWLAATAAAVVAVVLFAPTLSHGFVWDDRALILEDARIRSWAGVGRALGTDFLQSSEDAARFGYYRPLVTLSFAVDFAIWRLNPTGFHLSNLILHGLCAGAVVALGRRVGLPVLAAAGAGLLFAAHPMHIESVAWVSGRTDLLATALSLGFLLTWDHPRRAIRILGNILLAGALLSKELAIVVPAVAWLLPPRPGRRRLRDLTAAAAIIAAYLTVRIGVVPVRSSDGPPDGVVEHLLSPMAALWSYTRMLAWPTGQTAYIQNPPAISLLDPRVTMGLALALAAAHLWRLAPRTGRLVGAWFISLIPLVNIVRVAAPADMGFPLAERFLYFPSVLAALLGATAAHALARPIGPSPRRQAALALLLLTPAVGALGWATHQHLPVWRTELNLFQHTSATVQDAPLVEWLTAGALRRAGREREAHRLTTAAVQRLEQRGEQVPIGMRLTLASTTASLVGSGPARSLLLGIPTAERTALVWYNLGVLAEDEDDLDAATRMFQRAVDHRPDFGTGWLALGITQLKAGDADGASDAFARAVAIDPRHPDAWFGAGLAHRTAGRQQRALDAFLMSITLDPDAIPPRVDAAALLAATDPDRARRLLQEAASRHPDDPTVRKALTILRGQGGDGR